MKPIYLDYNATTPIDPEVKQAMLPFFEQFGNPSSSHWYGLQTKQAIEQARKHVADLLGCDTDEIYFTSGGSESNNLAIKGFAYANQHRGRHIITSTIEHPAVLQVCGYLQQQGFDITYIQVDEFGQVRIKDIKAAIRPDTILITIMHANNEVGTVQPIEAISELAKRHKIAVHTDAAQSVGKVPVRVADLGVDLLSIAGHKLYAPKGIGALYVRRGIQLQKQIHGADHEHNLRAGTENVLEIVGLGKACEIVKRDFAEIQHHLQNMGQRLYEGIKEQLDEFRLNGHPEQRLPNTYSISFRGLEANTILSELDFIAVSAGAACHADQVDVSHVLEAMNVPTEWAMGTLRLSVGKMTTAEEIDSAINEITKSVRQLRQSGQPFETQSTHIRLTHFTHGLGCACKLRPQALEAILAALPRPTGPNILVGTDSADDAAVYKLDDETAIVQSVDFFTPIVDDPYTFGAIAAANSLSDLYAMGAKPLFGLNIVGFPSNRLPMSVLEQMLQGAYDKASEAGISIIGGHTVDDTEPKYGLAVTGVVSPQRVLKNSGALPGDVLILTKPLGLGIVSTAIKRGIADVNTADEAIRLMSTLNRSAAEVAARFDIHACTDITGFGLLGHLLEMTRGSRVNAILDAKRVPVIASVYDLIAVDAVPGGTRDNLEYVSQWVLFDNVVSPAQQLVLADAQTSGGLLLAVAEKDAAQCVSALQATSDTTVARIGFISDTGDGHISIE